jgi:hypothetical protein
MVHLTKRAATTGREKAIKARYKSSSKKSTSKKDYTKAGKGSAGGKTSQTSAGKKFVEKKLGLVKTKHPTEGIVGTTATKLKGKDKKMYGEEASQATNEYLVSIGEATRGRKLDDGTYGYMLTSKGKEMKYGKSGGAMGSGDPSSIMGSTQISEEMFLKQKKIQGITLGVLSLFVPMFGGTLLRAAAADAAQAKYKEYGGTGGQFQSYQTGGKKFPDEKKVSEDKQIATSTIVGGTGVTGEKVSTTGKTLNLAAHLMGKSSKIRTFI